MHLIVNKITGRVVDRTALNSVGGWVNYLSEDQALAQAAARTGLAPEALAAWPAPDREIAERLLRAPLEALAATLAEGRVTDVTVDPAWTPPPIEPTELALLREAVNRNLLASPHDRRWLEQKEEAKSEGIPWIKAHPAAGQAEAETAINGAIEAAFPGQPRVVSGAGIIASYAAEAQARGVIPAATYEALRDFIAATPESQLHKLLAKL